MEKTHVKHVDHRRYHMKLKRDRKKITCLQSAVCRFTDLQDKDGQLARRSRSGRWDQEEKQAMSFRAQTTASSSSSPSASSKGARRSPQYYSDERCWSSPTSLKPPTLKPANVASSEVASRLILTVFSRVVNDDWALCNGLG